MSISNEDIRNNHVKTLSLRVKLVMGYIDAMFYKLKKGEIVEMTENRKEYILSHLQYIHDDLVKR